jgi:hypothetical protein
MKPTIIAGLSSSRRRCGRRVLGVGGQASKNDVKMSKQVEEEEEEEEEVEEEVEVEVVGGGGGGGGRGR